MNLDLGWSTEDRKTTPTIEPGRPKRIHAASTRFSEGGQSRVALPGYGKTYGVLENGQQSQDDGYCTSFVYYLQQVSELYQMLEARSAYGAEPAKTILGYRTSFLAGEGVRVSADTPELQDWIQGWLRLQGLTGRMLTDAVSEGEVVGHVLWTIDDMGMATCHPAFVGYDGWTGSGGVGGIGIGPQQYSEGSWEQPEWWPQFDGMRLTGVLRRVMAGKYEPWLEVGRDRFVFVRTGGHGNVARYPSPTTRMCAMIDSMKNYDRTVRQARELNSKAIRQSPTVELGPDAATDEQEVLDDMSRRDWQMGDVVVTRGKYHIESSDTGPVETLAKEAALIVKSLSGTSAIPPHWLGHTDLLSNRSTAESLFEAIKAGTLVERLAWEYGLDEMIRAARMVLNGPSGEFSVTMPLLSYHEFKERNESMLALLAADVISHEDVQGQQPFQTQHEPSTDPVQPMTGPQGIVRENEGGEM